MIASVAEGDAADIDLAVKAARQQFEASKNSAAQQYQALQAELRE